MQSQRDLLAESAELGLASRLKRLSERLYSEVQAVYEARRIEMNPRVFPLFFVLRQREQVGIVELADALGVTHAAVSMLVKKAKSDGYVSVLVPEHDERCRLVRLTKQGAVLVRKLEPIWVELQASLKNILATEAPDFLKSIATIEACLDRAPLVERLKGSESQSGVEILQWSPDYAMAFRDLNLEWIQSYFKVEAVDEKVLSNPEREIIDRGGMIFFARTRGIVAGTTSVIPVGEGVWELAKMAVTPLIRGKGVGRQLLLSAVAWVREQGGSVVYLETSSKLGPALKLYRSLGFKNCAPRHKTEFARVDVFMELELAKQGEVGRRSSALS